MIAPRMRRLMACGFLAVAYATAAISVGTTLPQGTTGQSYNTTLTASGGTSPYTSIISSGNLPMGLNLAPNGLLSGTPTAAGMYSFSIQTSDSMSMTGVTNLSLRVVSANGLQIMTTTLPAGMMGQSYDTTLTAQGGTAPYSFDLVPGGGMLPAGLSMTVYGRITGTPTAAGVYHVIVRVTDAIGNSYQSAMMIQIGSETLMLSTTSLSGGSASVPYSQTIAAIGGTGPYTYSVTSGTLPSGLTLSESGIITGTSATAGTYDFTIQAKDSTGATTQSNYSLFVGASQPKLVTTNIPNGILNQNYSRTLGIQGGVAPYTFTIVTGTLPPGLSISSTGAITGAPTSTGAYPVTIRVTDASGQSSQTEVFLNVNSSSFSITAPSLPDGFVGTKYSSSLTTTSSTGPYVFLLSTGKLPPGVVLNMTGALVGTPTMAGTYKFVVRAFDGLGQEAQVPAMIVVQPSGLSTSGLGLANGKVGESYTSTLTVRNGTVPYRFVLLSGSLPAGLMLSDNGNISGTPTASGLYLPTFRITDGTATTTTLTVPIYIVGNATGPMFSNYTLMSARPNQTYNETLMATGGTGPYKFALASGSLPAGLTLTPEGMLSGVPTQTTGAPFTVRVTDSAGNTSLVTYYFNINSSGLMMNSAMTPSGQLGKAYSYTFASTGGTGASTYMVESGSLPPGLALNSSGTLSGTPTMAGIYVVNVKVTDASGMTSMFSQLIMIGSSSLSFGSNQVPDATAGTAYSRMLTGSGGTAPYTYSLVSGTLPTGLTLGSNGEITGTATTAGSYPVTLRITDATGATATTSVTIVVKAASTLNIGSSLPSASMNTAYNYTLMATGGQAPYTYTLASGSTLPAGISLSSAGVLTGMSSTSGNSTFTVNVKDANGLTGQQTFTFNVGTSTLTIPNATFPNGTIGTSYDLTLNPAGGMAPYTVTVVGGTLPPGVTLSSAGVFSGSPTTAGTYPIVLRLSDSNGMQVQQSYTIVVAGNSGLVFGTAQLPAATVGQSYSGTLMATGGVAPYTYTVMTGTLPAGLTLGSTGMITGTPTAAGQASLTFQVKDANGATAMTTTVVTVN